MFPENKPGRSIRRCSGKSQRSILKRPCDAQRMGQVLPKRQGDQLITSGTICDCNPWRVSNCGSGAGGCGRGSEKTTPDVIFNFRKDVLAAITGTGNFTLLKVDQYYLYYENINLFCGNLGNTQLLALKCKFNICKIIFCAVICNY